MKDLSIEKYIQDHSLVKVDKKLYRRLVIHNQCEMSNFFDSFANLYVLETSIGADNWVDQVFEVLKLPSDELDRMMVILDARNSCDELNVHCVEKNKALISYWWD